MPDWPDSINEEVRQHLDDRYNEVRAGGASDEVAMRIAIHELDGADVSALAWVEPPAEPLPAIGADPSRVFGIVSDVRFAFRMLRNSPGFSAVVIFTLALGIGANTALFSVVNGVLLRPLPFSQSDQLVVLHESKQNFPNGSISYPNFRDWRHDNHTFSAMAISRGYADALTGRGDAEQVSAEFVTADFFSMLGVQPSLGRTFVAGEDEIGASPIVMVSQGFLARKLGGPLAARWVRP